MTPERNFLDLLSVTIANFEKYNTFFLRLIVKFEHIFFHLLESNTRLLYDSETTSTIEFSKVSYLVCIQTSEAEHSNLIRYMGPITCRTCGKQKTKLIKYETYGM